MNLMRFTIIDNRGTVSFVAHCNALAAMVAACAVGAGTLDELLTNAGKHYPPLPGYVLSGLAVFDEHNVDGSCEAIHAALRFMPATEVPVFRVIDEITKDASLNPVKAGLVIFNLRARRIIQVQNSFAEIERDGRVRVFDGAQPTSRVLRYHLPKEWSLVP